MTFLARCQEIGEPEILVSRNMRQMFDLVVRIVVFRRGRMVANLCTEEAIGNGLVACGGCRTGVCPCR